MVGKHEPKAQAVPHETTEEAQPHADTRVQPTLMHAETVSGHDAHPAPTGEPHGAAREQSHAEPRHAPPARPIVQELPPVALTLPPESGLEVVETRFKPASEPESELPAGPRRVRPPKVAVSDEPLQMVETTHKDAPPTTG